MDDLLHYVKRVMPFLGMGIGLILSITPKSPSDPVEYLKVLSSGVLFTLSVLSAVFQVVGLNLKDLVTGSAEKAILPVFLDIHAVAMGTLGYTLIIENRGNAIAEDVTILCSADGNLRLDQNEFHIMAIQPDHSEEFIPVVAVGSSDYSLDQNLNVKITWKSGFRRRSIQESFNLREVDRAFRNRLMARRTLR